MLERILRSPLVPFIAFTIFASITEYAGWGYAQSRSMPADGVFLFLVVFPLLFMIFLFLTLWWKPAALSGPGTAQLAAGG